MAYIRPAIFSFVLSILSIVVVAIFPLEITLRESGTIYSPYQNETDAIRVKTEKGLHPSAPEWKILDELIEKNNKWFEEEKNKFMQTPTADSLEAWKKKSDYLSPIIMIIWGITFYVFFPNKNDFKNLILLAFPIMFAIAQLMSLLEVVLISFIIFTIYFWFLVREKYDYRHT